MTRFTRHVELDFAKVGERDEGSEEEVQEGGNPYP